MAPILNWLLLTLLVPCFFFHEVQGSASGFQMRSIDFKIPLNECRIKIESNEILYRCKEKVYLFQKKIFNLPRADQLLEANSVLDADINSNNFAGFTSNTLFLRLKNGIEKQLRISDRVPILIRLNSIKDYSLQVLISRPLNGPTMSGNTTNEKNLYVIYTLLFGTIIQSHNTVFPDTGFDFELKDESFQDAVFLHDPVFGNDYLLVLLEGGWISVFRFYFEDPQLEFTSALRFRENFDILQISTSGNMVFVLFKSQAENRNILDIYTINSVSEFEFIRECSIDLETVETSLLSPQLRVKRIESMFLISINYPGVKIITTSFKKPNLGIFPLECPSSFNQIRYAEENTKDTIGYSFDHNIIEPQGFLLTPFYREGGFRSYFIPFCAPNYWMENGYGCVRCLGGFSKGGYETTCQSCDNIKLDDQHWIDRNKSSISNPCPLECENSDLFGTKCVNCETYLADEGAKLPPNAFATLKENGECSFNCEEGYPNEETGTCLATLALYEQSQDNCAQFTDCLNCTFSSSCSWSGGFCRTSNVSPGEKKDTPYEFFRIASECNMTEPCGPQQRLSATGNFTYSADSVYKNQLCSFYVEHNFHENRDVSFIVSHGNATIQLWDNPPNLFIAFCELRYLWRLCRIVPVTFQYQVRRQFRASDVIFFVWNGENMIGNASSFMIEYDFETTPLIFEQLYRIIKILSNFVFIMVIFTCIVSTCQKCTHIGRRRRILGELQGVQGGFQGFRGFELFRLVDNLEEPAPIPINIDNVMQDDRIVTRVVYSTNINEFEQTECPICLESFLNEEVLAKLSCKHLFHVNCFHDWVQAVNIQQHVKCPVCNRVLI